MKKDIGIQKVVENGKGRSRERSGELKKYEHKMGGGGREGKRKIM
jgi:hypothetical protein